MNLSYQLNLELQLTHFVLFGGFPGSRDDHWIEDHDTHEFINRLPNAGNATLKADQDWVAVTSGGGGFGEPIERDPESVRDDVRDGFVSFEMARDVYKVVIDTEPELFKVDDEATKKLRREALKENGGD